MRGWIRGNWRHLMVGLLCTAIVISSTVGADYTIRDYRITVSEAKVRSEMELIVLGIAEGLTFVD